MSERIRSFRARLRDGKPLVGTFVKTPAPVICELLSRAALDVVCIDAEHAPFGRGDLDHCIAALHAAGQPSLVRVSSGTATELRNALDGGATGVVVPHVVSAAQAQAIVRATRFGEGGRGYSGTTRAAQFGGKGMRAHLDDSHAHTTTIVQIEDRAALESVAAIAAVDGIDGLFIGRFDLAVAMGQDPQASDVVAAVESVCAAGRKAGIAVGLFVTGLDEIPRWRAAGCSLFLMDSDQGLMLAGARRLAAEFHGLDHGRG